MNYQRGPNQGSTPAIRAGLSVQELKAMTAMRMATSNEGPRGYASNLNLSHKFPAVNPASSYQTATPQQLQAAGIQPVVLNDRQMKSRLQKQNSQPLLGAGQSQFEDNNYYSRGNVAAQSSGYTSQSQQQQNLSPYHQQILSGGSAKPLGMQTAQDYPRRLGESAGLYSGSDLSPALRGAPQPQQQNMYNASRAELLQQSNSSLYGRGAPLGGSSLLRKDVLDIPQQSRLGGSGLYSQHQQHLHLRGGGGPSEEEDEDLLYIQNMGSASYGRNQLAAAGRAHLPPGLGQEHQQYGAQSALSQNRLQPVQTHLQQQQLLRSAPIGRVAPLRPLQQQYGGSDEESDGDALSGMLASHEQQQKQQQQLFTRTGAPQPQTLRRSHTVGMGSGLFGLPEDADRDGEEDGEYFAQALRQSGAFSDSFSELSLQDHDSALRHATAAGQQGTQPMKLGAIRKSQSQPLIPLATAQAFAAYPASPLLGASPVPGPRHAAPAMQGLVLPELASSDPSPHTSRENTPNKHPASFGRPSPIGQYQQQAQTHSPQPFLGDFQSAPVASPGGPMFLPQLGKARSNRNLLPGASPAASPLFSRKHMHAFSLGLGSGDADSSGEGDFHFASEIAESVLQGTPQAAGSGSGGGGGFSRSFNFSKDVNEFRALNSVGNGTNGHGLTLLKPAAVVASPPAQDGGRNELDELLAAAKNADYDVHRNNNNNEDEEQDGARPELQCLSRESSGSQHAYSNAVSPRGFGLME